MADVKEIWRGIKKNFKDSVGHIKENIVDPVAGLFAVQEGAKQRKGMVEDFMHGFNEDDDLSSLSAIMMAQNSRVDIVNISHSSSAQRTNKSARGPQDMSFLRKIAMPLLTRYRPPKLQNIPTFGQFAQHPTLRQVWHQGSRRGRRYVRHLFGILG